MPVYRLYKYAFQVLCMLLSLSILALGLSGTRSFNLEFITIGMLGLLAGFLPIRTINDFVRHPYALAFAYACYTIAITIWGVPFPLVVIGVLLSLMAIYLIGASGREPAAVKSEVVLLGKYSLLGYISQIAILQILSAGLRRMNGGLAMLVVSFVAAFALTILTVEVVDRARARAATVDRLYKAVFA